MPGGYTHAAAGGTRGGTRGAGAKPLQRKEGVYPYGSALTSVVDAGQHCSQATHRVSPGVLPGRALSYCRRPGRPRPALQPISHRVSPGERRGALPVPRRELPLSRGPL